MYIFIHCEDNWENKIRVSYHDVKCKEVCELHRETVGRFLFLMIIGQFGLCLFWFLSLHKFRPLRNKGTKFFSEIFQIHFIYRPFVLPLLSAVQSSRHNSFSFPVDFDMQERNISQQIYFDYFENAKVLIYFINIMLNNWYTKVLKYFFNYMYGEL